MKDLLTVDTPQFIRLREKLISYSFRVTLVQWKTHLIAVILSRAPVFEPEEYEDLSINTAMTCLKAERNPGVNEITSCIDQKTITWLLMQSKTDSVQLNSSQNTL